MEDISFYTSLSIFVCLLVTFQLFRQSKCRRYPNLPPSPSLSLPILGHLHLLKPPIHRTFHRLSQKHGPVFSLWFGSRRMVIVESSSAVQECFTKNDIALANRPPSLLGKHLGYNHTTLGGSPYGDHWRNIRRISTVEVLSTVRLNSFSDVRKEEIKHLLRKLSQSARGENRFSKVELKSMLNEMTYNNIMRMVAGKRYVGDHVSDKEDGKEFVEIMDEAFSYSGGTNPGEFMPFFNWFGGGGYLRKVKKLAKRSDVFLQGLIDEHRNKSNSESRKTMIGHLLSQQESQPEYYTDEIIKALILSLLLAGTDTSAVTVEWAMSNLVNHPNVLKKARAELDARIGEERLVNEGDLSKLPYLQSIISETLRLYPAAPMLLPHFSSKDCVISGFDIPRDTTVLVNAWAIHITVLAPKLGRYGFVYKTGIYAFNVNQIVSLTGSNYKQWKQDIELALGMLDYDHVIKDPCPPTPTTQTTKDDKQKYHTWVKHNKMALIVMKRSMSEAVRGGFPDTENAKELYESIAAKYRESEKAETGNLMSALINMKFDGVGSVREYIMKGIETSGKLKGLKIPIDDAMLVYLVLNSLPPQYSQLQTTYNTQKDKWNLNELISICVQEEDRIRKGKGIAVNLVSKPKNQYKAKKFNFKPYNAAASSTSKAVQGSHNLKTNKLQNLKCFFCRKPGHVKKDCNGFKDWLVKKGLSKKEDPK